MRTTLNPDHFALYAELLAGRTQSTFWVDAHYTYNRRERTLTALISDDLCDMPSSPLPDMLAYLGERAAAGDSRAVALCERLCTRIGDEFAEREAIESAEAHAAREAEWERAYPAFIPACERAL